MSDLVLLRASAHAVAGRTLWLPLAAATLLLVATSPLLDGRHALVALRGAAILLGVAGLAAMDDPAAAQLAASPVPLRRRAGARMVAVGLACAPVVLLAAVLAGWRSDVPLLGLALELAGLWAIGLTAAALLARRREATTPSLLAAPALVGVAVATYQLPRNWTLWAEQLWGPPWQAANLRWVSVLILCAVVLVAALRDPLDQ